MGRITYYHNEDRMGFSTAGNYMNPSLNINSTGNVGIGITEINPAYTLEVNHWLGISEINGNGPIFHLDATKSGTNGVSYFLGSATDADVCGGGKFVIGHDGIYKFTMNSDGDIGIGTTELTSKFQVVGLPEYADNAAALAAGLTVGAFYRTGDILKVVH